MDICKMKDIDWDEVSKIYLQGIDSRRATIVKTLPTYEQWDKEHIKDLRFVAKEKGQVVGFIAASGTKNVGIVSVYIKEGYKRKGIGTLLIRKLQNECIKYGYSSLNSLIFFDNIASIRLHQKTGFVLSGKTQLLGDNRDVCIYEWGA